MVVIPQITILDVAAENLVQTQKTVVARTGAEGAGGIKTF